jgi:hypothetical protein
VPALRVAHAGRRGARPAETAGYSPAVQEMTALLASKMPVAEASMVLERLTGIKVPRATLDREARRQGTRAVELRRALDARPTAPARQLELPLEPYQMILQIDAWNLRERDPLGRDAGVSEQGRQARTLALGLHRHLLPARSTRADRGYLSSSSAASRPRAKASSVAQQLTPKRAAAGWARRPAPC